ncbi:MAG: alpha/beta hydrolase [Leptospirales bacterium]|nr:alpha/beta hydrolase [Leptospirales bacterium]
MVRNTCSKALPLRILCTAIFAPALWMTISCNAAPAQLFYTPQGTIVETYVQYPQPLRIAEFPPGREASEGAVLFIHGGGWAVGEAALPMYAAWEPLLKGANLRAFAVEHRLPPRYRGRDQVEDIVRAIHYLESNALRFGYPPQNIALIGFSSGGHLAVLSALLLSKDASHPSPVRAVVAYYAPLDLERLVQGNNEEIRKIVNNYLPMLPRGEGLAQVRQAHELYYQRLLREHSPIESIHAAMPPMMLVHGEADQLVPSTQSEAFFHRAEEIAPGRTRLRLVPAAPHNFEISQSAWARDIEEDAVEFIVDHLEN